MISTETPPSPAARARPRILFAQRMVIKRSGATVRFDIAKITRAVTLAFVEVRTAGAPNPQRNDLMSCYGAGPDIFAAAAKIATSVSLALELYYFAGVTPASEQVHGWVEMGISTLGNYDEARAYACYRTARPKSRLSPAAALSE